MARTNSQKVKSTRGRPALGRASAVETPKHGFGGRPPAIAGIDRRRSVGLNTNAAPLEYLNYHRALATKADAAIADGADRWRWSAAMALRTSLEGGDYAGVRSPDLARIGRGGRPGVVSDHRLDCMKRIAKWRAAVPPRLFNLAVSIVGDDLWAWEKLKPGQGEKVLERFRLALDHIADDAGATPKGWMRLRWGKAAAR